jgi:hypothetical protein
VCRVNPGRYNPCDSALNQIGGECGQSIIVTVRSAVFDSYIAPFLIPGFGEAPPEAVHPLRHGMTLRNPITGIAGCCARAASGHAAALPRSVMKCRRLMGLAPMPRTTL